MERKAWAFSAGLALGFQDLALVSPSVLEMGSPWRGVELLLLSHFSRVRLCATP